MWSYPGRTLNEKSLNAARAAGASSGRGPWETDAGLDPGGGGTAAAAGRVMKLGRGFTDRAGRTCGVVTNRDIMGGSQNSGLHAWKMESPLTEKQKNDLVGCIKD